MSTDTCRFAGCSDPVYRLPNLGMKDSQGRYIPIPYVYCQHHVVQILTGRWVPSITELKLYGAMTSP